MTITPTKPDDRIQVIDTLRGLAIFGILIVNMQIFSGSNWEQDLFTGKLDQLMYWSIEVFAENKFLNIFSFLFGVGFGIQLSNSIKKSTNFKSLYVRRLLILFLFGIIHGIFIAWVDVLSAYAILGCLLLLVYSFSDNAIKILLIICFLTPYIYDLSEGLNIWNQSNKEYAVQKELKPKLTLCYSCFAESHKDGTYRELVLMRVGFWRQILTSFSWYISLIGNEFVMFLIGYYVSRKKIFQNLHKYITQLNKILPWLIISGLFITLVGIYSEKLYSNFSDIIKDTLSNLLFSIGAIAMSAFYVIRIIIINNLKLRHKCFIWLAKVGRMSLSNYLFQSIICSFIFYEYGLGYYGKLGPTLGFLLTLLIFVFQIYYSNWWLKRARFGPFEWIWRSITYGKFQSFRNK